MLAHPVFGRCRAAGSPGRFELTPCFALNEVPFAGWSDADGKMGPERLRHPSLAELSGGLPVPRQPAEIENGLSGDDVLDGRARVLEKGGRDVTALFVAGAMLQSGPLADLGLALLVGMIAGAYSSLFIAAPLLAWLREREPGMVAHREQIERRKKRHEAKAEVKASHHREAVAATATTSPTGTTPSDAQARQQRRTASSRADRKKHK